MLWAAALGCALSGCSLPIADVPASGPADTSLRPRDVFLPVHDLPPDRGETVISPDQRAKIEADLAAVRDRQAQAAATQSPTPQASQPQASGPK